MIPPEMNTAVLVETGIDFFGMKVFILTPENFDPAEVAAAFTKQINDLIDKAAEPSLRELCEMSARHKDVLIKSALNSMN